MKNSTKIIILNVILIFSFALFQIINKEKLINNGDLVLFNLRPVDPRSLMQGDYMILRYAITRSRNYKDTIPQNGYIVFKTDSFNIATKVRFQKERTPLYEDEKVVKYIYKNNEISIGSESYFFQEGTGGKYSGAEYGVMKIDTLGNSTLIGLYDNNKKLIK